LEAFWVDAALSPPPQADSIVARKIRNKPVFLITFSLK